MLELAGAYTYASEHSSAVYKSTSYALMHVSSSTAAAKAHSLASSSAFELSSDAALWLVITLAVSMCCNLGVMLFVTRGLWLQLLKHVMQRMRGAVSSTEFNKLQEDDTDLIEDDGDQHHVQLEQIMTESDLSPIPTPPQDPGNYAIE